jgi:hypothetical protein
MNTIELWPSPVLGPASRNKLGNPGAAMPRWVTAPSCQASDSSTSSRVIVAPAGGVEGGALEGVDAGHVGHRRLAQRAGSVDHDVGPVHLAVTRVQRPPADRGVEPGFGDLGFEPQVGPPPVTVGDPCEVGLDLWLRRVGAGPVGVERERERVEVQALVPQLDGRADAREPRADDGDLESPGRRLYVSLGHPRRA